MTGAPAAHSHACWLADSGVELAKIRDLLRHTDVLTTMRYVKIRDAAKHDAIALLKGPPALTTAPQAVDSPSPTGLPIA